MIQIVQETINTPAGPMTGWAIKRKHGTSGFFGSRAEAHAYAIQFVPGYVAQQTWREPTGERLVNEESEAERIHKVDGHAADDFHSCGRCQADWGRSF